MININSDSYTKLNINGEIIETTFTLENCTTAIANSIRRTILSNIPIVTFDDTWYNNPAKRSILIHKNTSAIHNEFLSHRLSLLPINMYKTSNLKIVTILKDSIRSFNFKNNDNVPTFYLKLKNNEATRTEKNMIGYIKVFSNDFRVKNKITDIEEDINDYILPDPYTNDYCIIDLLKSNILDDNEGEELDLEAKPTIGNGLINARYTPVGTVSYSFEVDESNVESVFNLEVEYKNTERSKKKIAQLSNNEISVMKKSFNLLGKERVFKCNNYGEANCIKFCVESIGFLGANQIVMDSLYILELKLRDILNSIKFKEENNEIIFTPTDKLLINKSYSELNSYNIILNNENHTIGNLISEYNKMLYCGEDPIDTDILSFTSYKMPHPLKEIIEIKLILNSKNNLKNLYNILINYLIKDTPKTNKSDEEIDYDIIIMIFIKTIQYILNDIEILKNKWNELNDNSLNSSFEIMDSDEYFNHLNNNENILIKNLL